MASKSVVFILALIAVGSLALPAQDVVKDDLSPFFINADQTSSRIIGGSQASTGSAPYMVALTIGNLFRSFFCGASVVSQRSILTAAHCTAAVFSGGSLVSSLRGQVGSNLWASGGTQYTISRNVSHPGYSASTIKNDICVLITNDNIVFSPLVQPVPLSYNWVGAGLPVRANGWGRIVVGGPSSPTLLELRKHTVDGAFCQQEVQRVAALMNIAAPPVNPAVEICTFHSAGSGMCHGDSGSALVRQDNLEQIGVVSWGVPCARGAPDMFVRVSAYQAWLREVIVY